MAEFVNPVGKIRGKIGNVIGYVRENGKNYCKGTALTRKPGGEPQKRQSMAFSSVIHKKTWMAKAIRLGFPGGNGYPKGFNGFTSANVKKAVTVEKIDPEKATSKRKKAPQEFKGIIDYKKLRVAAGQLDTPAVHAEIDAERRKVFFTHGKVAVEAVDRFLDDEIYGVLLYEAVHHCSVARLGTRGETFNTGMDFPEDATAEGLLVYVFARAADGKDASDSVCLKEPAEPRVQA